MTCRWPQVCQTRVAERFELRCTVLDDAFLLLRKTAQLHLWMYEVYRNTVLPSRQYNPIISNLYIYIYLDNPSVQNYRSKSETAIIIAGCLNFRCFQFFSPFQFPHFGLLIFFALSSGFFAVSSGFFAVSKPANICNMRNMQNLFGGRKNAASNNSWKGNNFAYIGRRRYMYLKYPQETLV